MERKNTPEYDWRDDLDSIDACEEVRECADGCCTIFRIRAWRLPRHNDECIRLAAYIERLEAERDALIAAAPEMYKAIAWAMEILTDSWGEEQLAAGDDQVYNVLAAALAKAEGRA